MSIEKLKQLLEQNLITQEEFDAMSQSLNEPAPTAEPEPTPSTDPEPEPKLDDNLNKLIQAKIDRALAQERKEKTAFKKKVEQLQKKMLTDEEAKELELKNQQEEIEEQRRELTLEKNKMYAVKALQKANISNTEETMSVIEKIVSSCEDETDIDELISLLKTWHDNSVKAEVDKRFKDGGYTPAKGTTLNGGVNPWAKGQKNLTAQMKIEIENPEMAAQLKAAAGVKY